MTKRALLLGAVLSLGIGLILPVTEFLIQGTRLGLSSATPAAFFLLFVILVGPQFLLRCLNPAWSLSRSELLVVFSMMMVATVIPTRGFGGPFFSMATGAIYFASAENEWATQIQPHLSPMIVLKNAGAVRQMYEGLEGSPVPWEVWLRPLGWWTVFMVCLAMMVISVMFLFRQTWVERERLVFPIAQVALAMVEDDPKGSRLNPLFHSGLFWMGFLIPMGLESLNTLSRYFPEVPTFRPNWTLSHDIPGVPPLTLRLNFLMFGFAFFIESQLSFSLWFFYLLSLPAHWVYGRFFAGHGEALGPWTSGGPGGTIMAHQQMGAMLVLVGTMVWTARQPIVRLRGKNTSNRGRASEMNRGKDSTPTFLAMFLISALLMSLMISMTGVPGWIAPLVVGSALVIWLSLTRLMAQAGIATIVPAIVPLGFVVSAVGTPNLGTVGLIAMGLTLVWSGDLLTYLMGPAANSVYVGHRANVKPFAGALSMLAAVILSLIGCFVMTLYLTGKVGGLNLHPQYFQTFPQTPWQFAESKLLNSSGASVSGYLWTGVGAGVMLLLTYAQRLFFWWPLHPLGFLAQGGWIMRQLWFSFFLAWLVKTAVLRYGGGASYKKARVFFVGIIVGLLVVGGLWLIVDSLTGMRGNGIRIY
jgi:hypothetical protein